MSDQHTRDAEKVAALHAYEKAIKAEASGTGSSEATAKARQTALGAGADSNALYCAASGFIPEKVRIGDYPDRKSVV